jgi:hypothetical protein
VVTVQHLEVLVPSSPHFLNVHEELGQELAVEEVNRQAGRAEHQVAVGRMN